MTISNEMLGAAKIKVLGVGGGGCNAITRTVSYTHLTLPTTPYV